jgi:hypothetical protein
MDTDHRNNFGFYHLNKYVTENFAKRVFYMHIDDNLAGGGRGWLFNYSYSPALVK